MPFKISPRSKCAGEAQNTDIFDVSGTAQNADVSETEITSNNGWSDLVTTSLKEKKRARDEEHFVVFVQEISNRSLYRNDFSDMGNILLDGICL